MNIEGIDLVALASIGVCGILVYCGHDGYLITLMSTVIGYYFGRKSGVSTSKDGAPEA